jgi:hypothetical protein
MDRSTLTVAGTNDTNMSYITRGLWGVTGVLLFVVFGWLLLIEVGGTPLSHLVPMIVPRGTLPRGGLGCAFGQCSFPHRIACDTDAWAWVGSLSSSIPLSLANVYPWPRHPPCVRVCRLGTAPIAPPVHRSRSNRLNRLTSDRGSEYSMVGLGVPS